MQDQGALGENQEVPLLLAITVDLESADHFPDVPDLDPAPLVAMRTRWQRAVC